MFTGYNTSRIFNMLLSLLFRLFLLFMNSFNRVFYISQGMIQMFVSPIISLTSLTLSYFLHLPHKEQHVVFSGLFS